VGLASLGGGHLQQLLQALLSGSEIAPRNRPHAYLGDWRRSIGRPGPSPWPVHGRIGDASSMLPPAGLEAMNMRLRVAERVGLSSRWTWTLPGDLRARQGGPWRAVGVSTSK